jgi:ABC-type proline/glycine betaine transport system substrate-binding protein
MSYPNQQIGWSNEENLLRQIIKQLDYLTKVIGASITTTTTTTAP